jgi:hypothetical protein
VLLDGCFCEEVSLSDDVFEELVNLLGGEFRPLEILTESEESLILFVCPETIQSLLAFGQSKIIGMLYPCPSV